MSFITVNNAKFYVETTGEGHPLILISGYGADHTAWMGVVPELSKHFKVVTFDNRGIGLTEDEGAPLTIEQMADDVMAIADALGLESPHICGLSMGGNIAQSIGIRYSDKIGKLICLATVAKWRKAVVHGILGMIQMQKDGASIDAALHLFFGWLVGERFLSNADNVAYVREMFENDPNPQKIEDKERQVAAIAEFDSRDRLKHITVPTLIGYGKEDMVSFESEAQFLADAIPNATLQGFECAHIISMEQPAALAEAMIAFLT